MKPVKLIFTIDMIVDKTYKQIMDDFAISTKSSFRVINHFKTSDEPYEIWRRGKNRVVAEVPSKPKEPKIRVKQIKPERTKHIAVFLGKTKEYKPRLYYKQFIDANFSIKDDELIIETKNRTMIMELSSVPVLQDIKSKPVKNIIEFSDHVVYCFTDVRFGRKNCEPLYELRQAKKIHIEELEDIFEQLTFNCPVFRAQEL